MRLIVHRLILGLLCALPAFVAQAATPVTYFFYGRVSVAAGGGVPPVDTVVPISVTVDMSFPALYGDAHTAHYHGGVGYNLPSPILAATVNGSNAHGIFDDVYISHNDNGASSIQISSFSPGAFGFDVNLTSSVITTVHSLYIPRRIYPGNFMSATFYNTLNEKTSYSGQIIE